MTQPLSGAGAGSGDRHLDLDAAADLDEGLLEQSAAAAARAHVDGCARCGQTLAQVRTTRALLSAMPTDQMPADVAARLDAALRRAAEEPRPNGNVVPFGRRRTWNTATVAGAAAALAILVLVAAVVAGSIRSGGHSGTKSGGRAASGVTPTAAPASQLVRLWATGHDYSAPTLATLVPPLVTQPTTTARVVSSPAASPASTAGYSITDLRASTDAVAACGRILSGGTGVLPLAVDFARFDGKPAAVFAFDSPGHPESLDVWVVRSTCGQSTFDFYFRRIPRSA